jgi:hypothetical protein
MDNRFSKFWGFFEKKKCFYKSEKNKTFKNKILFNMSYFLFFINIIFQAF